MQTTFADPGDGSQGYEDEWGEEPSGFGWPEDDDWWYLEDDNDDEE